MAIHPRAELRRLVVAKLKARAGNPPVPVTDCGDRVFESRIKPLQSKTQLPAISVYTMREPTDTQESHSWADPDNPGIVKRRLQLAIEIVTSGDESDDLLDQIALQVETVMDADPTLGNRVESVLVLETTVAFADSGEKIIGAALLTYEIVYRTKTIVIPGPDGTPVTMVLGSWAPNIGAAHIDDYVDITDTGVPPLP